MGWSLTHTYWIKIQEGYLRSKQSQTHTRPPSPGFQCQEGKSPQLLAAKSSRDWVSGRNLWSPKQFLLQNSHMDSPTQITPFELQNWGNSLKGTSGIKGETGMPGIEMTRGHCPFSKVSPHGAGKMVPYLRFHRWLTTFDPPWRCPDSTPPNI